MAKYKQTYKAIRETFVCSAALADYLGRSRTYVETRLLGYKEFSTAEKIAISAKVGLDWEVIECMSDS